MQGIGTTVDTADRNLRNLEWLTRPLGERGEGMVAQVDKTIGRLEEVLQQAVFFTRALNETEGTLSKLVRDPKVYEDLAQAVANLNNLMKGLRPIVDDVRMFTAKIAPYPEQFGVRGALAGLSGVFPGFPISHAQRLTPLGVPPILDATLMQKLRRRRRQSTVCSRNCS